MSGDLHDHILSSFFCQVESLSGMLRGADEFYVAGYERFKGPGDAPRDQSPEKKKPKYNRDAPPTDRQERTSRTSKSPAILTVANRDH